MDRVSRRQVLLAGAAMTVPIGIACSGGGSGGEPAGTDGGGPVPDDSGSDAAMRDSSNDVAADARVISDPGTVWRKTGVLLESDRPDDDGRILCPAVLGLAGGGFRVFYMGQGTGSPNGSRGRILSARSEDGVTWTKEPGVRVDHHPGAEVRVLSPSVVAKSGGFRMYYEAWAADGSTSIMSAVSADGLAFTPEAGTRVAIAGATIGSPRVLALADGAVRLYFHRYPDPFAFGLDAGNHVESALAQNGLAFTREPGARIEQTIEALEFEAVYCAQPVDLGGGRVRVYYGAWNGLDTGRGAIMTALSSDGGTTLTKNPTPVVFPDTTHDASFASEPCVYRDAKGTWRMIYEAADASGVTRLLGAVAGT